MQEPVVDRRKEDTDKREERNAAEQGIEGGEEFPCLSLHLVHRPHSGEYHGGVQERIDPWEVSIVMVP